MSKETGTRAVPVPQRQRAPATSTSGTAAEIRVLLGGYGPDVDRPRLTHVRVNVRDLNRALDWYERLLGVAAEGHWPPDDPTYAHFNVGAAQFAVGQYEPTQATGARFNFEVDDVDAWWLRLSDESDVLEPLFDTPYGTRKFSIRDPDGNELGFVQAR